MSSLARFSVFTLALMALSPWHFCLGRQGVASTAAALKAYPLHGRINSADISPDETLVAVERTSDEKTENVGVDRLREIIELWDFRADKLVASATLRVDDVQKSAWDVFVPPIKEERFVRFTGDGKLLVAYVEPKIRVFTANDLQEVRCIIAQGPPTISRTYSSKRFGLQTLSYGSAVQAFEMSPTGELLAMRWTRGMDYGRIDIYDIASGQCIATWLAPKGPGPFDRDRGLAWSSTSQTVFLAVPNTIPCLQPRGALDVFGFDPWTGRIQTALATGVLVGDIAVTPSGQLLAVDFNCVGVFGNHHPKLKVFDLKTNRLARDVSAAKTGVRYRVSVSRNGQRAAAWTSDVRCQFDWGDMVCGEWTVKSMFTVWRLPDFSVAARSEVASREQPFQDGPLRLSSTGRYLLMYGTTGWVFEVP